MFAKFFKKTSVNPIPNQIYGGLMTQAREPYFYAHIGIEDSVMGRFDMLSLHVYLLSRRMKKDVTEIASSLSQDVFDLFVDDLDRGLRQLGVGDTTVPKRKRKMIHSFYAQIDEFDTLLDTNNKDELARKVQIRYLSDENPSNSKKTAELTDYITKTASQLNSLSIDEILKGNVTWPSVKI